MNKDLQRFSKDYLKMSDKDLLNLREQYMETLFNGYPDSPDHKEKEALIDLIDKEIERRYKRQAIIISWIALIVSITSILIAILFKK